MTGIFINQQCHGYRNGHQLLSSSIKLSISDQDLIDRLSDLAGSLKPDEKFEPYLTGYPLPSREYYVLAKTWQDVGAPRAGCVITRSLIVPMKIWQNVETFSSFLGVLKPIDKDSKEEKPLEVILTNNILPPVRDERVFELVEALFLEKRQAIVMFDAFEAELIVERLLAAFWPALKTSFSFCTFSMAPRKIEGREFDLLFAPKTSRARFVDWVGRRIEIAHSTIDQSRHRWTIPMAQKIFQSSKPSLLAIDNLGILPLDNQGNEAALRISLLWNELLEKLETSPTALLGMLDILNSQNMLSQQVLVQLKPILEKTINLTVSSFAAAEAVQFFITFIEKISAKVLPGSILRKLRKSLSSLAEHKPNEILEFIYLYDSEKELPIIIWAALANGFANAFKADPGNELYLKLPAQTTLELIAYSRNFASLFMQQISLKYASSILEDLIYAFEIATLKIRNRVRRHLFPILNNYEHTTLLSVLLDGIKGHALENYVSIIGRNTQFKIEAFDAVFNQLFFDVKSVSIIRKVILSFEETEYSNRFLLSTLTLSATDTEWLYSERSINSSRITRLLIALFNRCSDSNIKKAINSSIVFDKVVNSLLGDIQSSAGILARLLMLKNIPIEGFLDIGQKILPYLEGGLKEELSTLLFSRGLNEVRDYQIQKQIFSLATNAIDTHDLIQITICSRSFEVSITDSLSLLNNSESNIRNKVLGKIDYLTDLLIKKQVNDFTLEDFKIWASLLEDASEVDAIVQLRASEIILDYAFRLKRNPVSPLIMVAFPIVYKNLCANQNKPTGFMLFGFVDLDKCKSMSRDLVDAFLHSSWPPADLLLAAINAGEPKKILQKVISKPGGKKYLLLIEKDLSRFPKADRQILKDLLSNF